ncbi:site-2 protease family protein [bacterium]|nr:site-2 protease family protein [bacterium]QQR59833.1 MAG: site-2 protease family protein [Candidatus Melainabacteria bacterium]
MESAIFIIVAWILSTCLHEFGHAFVAYLGGDTTVKDRGYLTLNPIAYFNSATTLVLPILMLLLGGIPLPGAAVMINTSKLKNRFWISLTSFAGPFFSLLCLIGFIIAYKVFASDAMSASFPSNVVEILRPSLALLIWLETYVLILNLIPMPPLDGWGIIEPWMPENIQIAARRNGNIGFLIIMLSSFTVPIIPQFMGAIAYFVTDFSGVPDYLVASSFKNFREFSMPIAALIIVTFILKNLKSPAQKAAEAKQLQELQAQQIQQASSLSAAAASSEQIVDVNPMGVESDEKNKTQI